METISSVKVLTTIERLELEIEALKQQLYTDKEAHQKEIALVREDAQVQILRLEKRINELLKISEDHQKLNGELQKKLSNCEETLNEYRDVAAQFRRKGVL